MLDVARPSVGSLLSRGAGAWVSLRIPDVLLHRPGPASLFSRLTLRTKKTSSPRLQFSALVDRPSCDIM